MSDTSPRRIGGLAPRRDAPPLSRLVKAERDRAPQPAAPDIPAEPAASAPAVIEPPAAAPAVAAAVPASATASDGNIGVTFRIPMALRNRSRAAYKATSNAENDATYSDMVAKAIDAELRRREALYNGGAPYGGGEGKLASGRPFADWGFSRVASP